jgi:putative ABC transport system permease protein
VAFKKVATIFPVFNVSGETLALQAVCALVVALASGIVPAVRAARIRIVDGLRSIA